MNVFEKAITGANGEIDINLVRSLIPHIEDEEKARGHILELLSRTSLSEAFIGKYLDILHFGAILKNSEVPQYILEERSKVVFNRVVFDLHREGDYLNMLLAKDYSVEYKESLIKSLFTYISTTLVDEEAVDTFATMINAYADRVSKQFILDNTHDIGYMFLSSALKRNDFSTEEVLERIDDVTYDELFAWISMIEEAEDSDNEDEAVPAHKKELVYAALKYKTERSIARI